MAYGDGSGRAAEGEIDLPCPWCAPPLPPALEEAIAKGLKEASEAFAHVFAEESNGDEGEQAVDELDCQPNPGALEKLKRCELERILKEHGTNAHKDKEDTVGSAAGAYEYSRDKETGEIYLVPKDGGDAIPAGLGNDS